MGDPKKLRKKYSKPSHPWQKLRIEDEKVLMKEYGFKNKKELWKLNSKLKDYKSQIKMLISKHDEASEKKKNELIQRLQSYNLLSESAVLEDILALTLKDLCERRLQTIVFKKQLARSINQARQFITHEHVSVGEKKITSPSYLVSQAEELMVKISDNSPMVSEDHPERIPVEKKLKEEKKKTLKKDKKVEDLDTDEGEGIVLDEEKDPTEVIEDE